MGNYDQYPYERSATDKFTYEFISKGAKGEIKMGVRFQPTLPKNIFNLAFGNMKEDGTIDDQASNNNGDRNKVLNTVATIVFEFTESIPGCFILFAGSTAARTRLYRMAITINLFYITAIFEISGILNTYQTEPFQVNKNYLGFFIKRK